MNYNTPHVNGQYPVNTEATASCNSGYTQSGSRARTCQADGEWNGNAATCISNDK